MESEKLTAQYTSVKIQRGYPELDSHRIGRILTNRHLQIDKCPATVTRFEITTGLPQPIHCTCLCVFSPDHGSTYLIGSIAGNSNGERIDREMEAIAASFHIERAGDPAASKR